MASVKIPEQKVILCGEFGVGKSSLFRRFMSDTFTTATDRSMEFFYTDSMIVVTFKILALV